MSASAFYLGFARQRLERRFLIWNVCAGKVPLCRRQHVAPVLRVERAWYDRCNTQWEEHFLHMTQFLVRLYFTLRALTQNFALQPIKTCYVHVSVNHKSILINVQRDATNAVYILLQDHSTCFGCRSHPSSRVHKTVVTATGTSHTIVHLPHSNVAKLDTLEWGRCTIIWLVPVTVTTVLCTPDDGCGRHPKHVEWYCNKI